MPPLAPILENLSRTQSRFLRAADSVSADCWKTRPGQDRWSAAELVSHLISVERAIIRNIHRVLQSPPKQVPFFKRVHVPLAVVEWRLIRRQTPIPIDLQLVGEKEQMLADLRDVRERTVAFVQETKDRDLRAYTMPHPFLGTFNAYEWFRLIASHEVRHTKQMLEISATLPKAVAILQK